MPRLHWTPGAAPPDPVDPLLLAEPVLALVDPPLPEEPVVVWSTSVLLVPQAMSVVRRPAVARPRAETRVRSCIDPQVDRGAKMAHRKDRMIPASTLPP